MTRYTFPKHKRLLKSGQFRRVGKHGRPFYGKFLTIHICDSRKSTLKLGLTVSRKYGKAIKRNRFKRLMREAFRHLQHDLPQKIHLNVRPTNTFDQAHLEEVKAELSSICKEGMFQSECANEKK